MPWGAVIEVVCQIIGLVITDQARRNKLKLQMYEFAKKYDKDVIEGNQKLREEYARMREELEKMEKGA